MAATAATAATFRRGRGTVHGRHDPTVGRRDAVGRGRSDRAAGTVGIEGGWHIQYVSNVIYHTCNPTKSIRFDSIHCCANIMNTNK